MTFPAAFDSIPVMDHLSVEVIQPRATQALGLIQDGTSTLIMQYGSGRWTPVGAILAGSDVVESVPNHFSLASDLEARLDATLAAIDSAIGHGSAISTPSGNIVT